MNYAFKTKFGEQLEFSLCFANQQIICYDHGFTICRKTKILYNEVNYKLVNKNKVMIKHIIYRLYIKLYAIY